MNFKLRSDRFTSRIPLGILRKNNTIFFQLQHAVLGDEGYQKMIFCEYSKINTINFFEIGSMAIKLLNRFHEISDFTPHELEDMISNKDNDLPNESNCNHLEFVGAKDWNEYEKTYDSCNINYYIFENRYDFTLWWYKKGTFGNCSHSTGEPGILTFDTPLEFTDYSDPEALGKMIVEALDRSRKISDKIAGNPYPEKNIELLNSAKLIVSTPRDKHFADEEDNGVGELYQIYGYYPREDSEERSAAYYIGIAAELDCDLSEDNVRNAWEKLHGKAEFFEVKQAEHGIWKLRAEMRNKSVHRISYLLQIDESELLDCTMELHKPNTRKKLDEKLTAMFEEFARQCKFKNQSIC